MSDIADLLHSVKNDGIAMVVLVPYQVFEADAWKFLEFAHADLDGQCERGNVNALTNAKRAIENRVDVLLYGYGMRAHAKRDNWNYPKKAEHLRWAGIFVPEALRNLITSTRNDLEHNYEIPRNRVSVANSVEIAELFLRSTDAIVNRGFFRLFVGPRSLNSSYDLTSMKIGNLPKESFGALIDHPARLISQLPLANSTKTTFLDMGADEIAELFRILSASIEMGTTRILGPLLESAFRESFT